MTFKSFGQTCHIESAPLFKYSKLRQSHSKSTSSDHVIQGDIIRIKVPGIYSYARGFSVRFQ